MMFSETERRSFARHESEQRQYEATLSFAERLAMLEQMQRVAALFGHDQRPTWARAGDLDARPASTPAS